MHVSVHVEGDAIVQAASALLPPGEHALAMTYATDYPTGRGTLDVTARAIKPPGRIPSSMGYMTVATDTFAGFVDHLAEALDDPTTTGVG